MSAIRSKEKSKTFPVSVPPDLEERLVQGCTKTRLKKQDLVRLSIDFGLDHVIEALTARPAGAVKSQ